MKKLNNNNNNNNINNNNGRRTLERYPTCSPSEHEEAIAAMFTHKELCGPNTPTLPDTHSPHVLSSRRPSAPQSSRFKASQSGAAVQLAAFRLELATSSTWTQWVATIRGADNEGVRVRKSTRKVLFGEA